jgi:hypothetical protein
MAKEIKEGSSESFDVADEHEKKALMRCFNMVDYISETASNIIIDLIFNIPCPETKQFLLTKPEELAFRAFEKALNELGRGGRRREEQAH